MRLVQKIIQVFKKRNGNREGGHIPYTRIEHARDYNISNLTWPQVR